jgi:hypothetical protein
MSVGNANPVGGYSRHLRCKLNGLGFHFGADVDDVDIGDGHYLRAVAHYQSRHEAACRARARADASARPILRVEFREPERCRSALRRQVADAFYVSCAV